MTTPETRQYRRATARANAKRQNAKVWGKHHKPFRRALEQFKAIETGLKAIDSLKGQPLAYSQALLTMAARIGPYVSRGHGGKGRRHPAGISVAAVRRAATKRRNVLRSRGQYRQAVR